MHLKSILTNISKGSQSITEFLQHAKSIADELAMLDAPENSEDLTVKILNGLGDEFKDISAAIRARDSAITFEELHEKLLNFEAVLKQETSATNRSPITANYIVKPYTNGNQTNHYRPTRNSAPAAAKSAAANQSNNSSPKSGGPRPYRGFCQLCGDQGHTAKRCSTYSFSPIGAHQRQQVSNSRAQ